MLATQLRAAFPKFAFAGVSAEVVGETSMDDAGDEYRSYTVVVQIPIRARLAAGLLDIDYAAPVWFPIAVVAYWVLA